MSDTFYIKNLKCAYCGESNDFKEVIGFEYAGLPYAPEFGAEFVCKKCKQKNKVLMDFVAVKPKSKEELVKDMGKDFDGWNNVKKLTNSKPDNFGVHEREIWWTSFGINVGVEIDGKNEYFERPSLILRKFNRQMVWVLPTTQQAKDEKFHEEFSFGGETFFVALTQIRTVSTKRFLRKIGMLSQEDFDRVKARITEFVQENGNPPLSGFPRRPKP